MGLFDRLAAAGRALVGRPQAASGLTEYGNLPAGLAELVRGTAAPTIAGVPVSPDRAMGVSAVYACVRILRTTLSHLPLVLYRTDGRRREPATADPLYRLLHDQPNEWQTSLEWREGQQSDIELRGDGFSLIVRGFGGRVVELVPLPPDAIEVIQDRATMRLTYRLTKANGQRVDYPRRDILHIRGAGTGIRGVSPIRLHRETVGDAIAMQQHGSRFFSNGAKPLGALYWELPDGLKPDLSEAARKELKADMEAMYQGGENAHKPLLLPFGLKYDQISISMEDAQYIEGRKFSRQEIFSIFGVPPHKAGDLDKATFSNIEHQALEFVTDAIVPRAVRWEQAIKRDLLAGDPDRYVRHTIDGLLRGDAKSRAESLQIKRRNGVISANEWRELDDMNPRDDAAGDGYIIEANMRPDDGTDPVKSPPANGGRA